MWDRLSPLLPPQRPRTGRPALTTAASLRPFSGWRAPARPSGASWRRLLRRADRSPVDDRWRDLPPELMNWRTAWRRQQRWTAAGIWGRLIEALRTMAADAGWDANLLDSSVIRAHAHAAGAPRRRGEQALGRSPTSAVARRPQRCCRMIGAADHGFSTKLHLRCDGRGRPVALHLTSGERHDLLGVAPLFDQGVLRTGRRGRPRWKPAAVIADKAWSAAWLLEAYRRKRIVPVIPSRTDQPENPAFNRERLPATQPDRAARRQAQAVPARRDPLRQARCPLPRLRPDRLSHGLATHLWRHGLGSGGIPAWMGFLFSG